MAGKLLLLVLSLSLASIVWPTEELCSHWNTTVISTVQSSFDCISSTLVDAGKIIHTKLCSSLSLSRIEYIVSFKGYYSEDTRDGYLTAALQSTSCKPWHTIQRTNPSQQYPSDFSVIHFPHANHSECLVALETHPLIKLVTPHRKFSRSLACINDPPHLKTRKILEELAVGNKWVVGRRLLRAIPRQITSALHANVLWTMGNTGKNVKVRMIERF